MYITNTGIVFLCKIEQARHLSICHFNTMRVNGLDVSYERMEQNITHLQLEDVYYTFG